MRKKKQNRYQKELLMVLKENSVGGALKVSILEHPLDFMNVRVLFAG